MQNFRDILYCVSKAGLMIRSSQIRCTYLRMEFGNFNVDEIVNIPQRHYFNCLYISISNFNYLRFNSTDNTIISEKLSLLITLYNLFYSTNNLVVNLSVIHMNTLLKYLAMFIKCITNINC